MPVFTDSLSYEIFSSIKRKFPSELVNVPTANSTFPVFTASNPTLNILKQLCDYKKSSIKSYEVYFIVYPKNLFFQKGIIAALPGAQLALR